MQANRSIMLRILCNHFDRTLPESAFKCLPTEIKQELQQQTIRSEDLSPAITSPYEQVEAMHYSWLIPAIKQLSPQFYPTVLGALSPKHRQKIMKTLSISDQIPTLAEPVRNYFIHKIYHTVKPRSVLPLAYLPDSPLNLLTSLNKSQMVELIYFLGIHDLAESIRHIIDKAFLQKLYKCLSTKQRQFLRICLHQQEKIVTERLDFSQWKGDCESLNLMMHQRGLFRLGKTLSGQHPDLVWHIAHTLDSGRGGKLIQYFSAEATPSITARLIQQVINLMNFFRAVQKS